MSGPFLLAQKFDPASPIHIVSAARHGMGYTTFCTGRHLSESVPVEGAPASCRLCLARARREGIDPADPGGLDGPAL